MRNNGGWRKFHIPDESADLIVCRAPSERQANAMRRETNLEKLRSASGGVFLLGNSRDNKGGRYQTTPSAALIASGNARQSRRNATTARLASPRLPVRRD